MENVSKQSLQAVVLILEEAAASGYAGETARLARELEAHHISFHTIVLSDGEPEAYLQLLEKGRLRETLYLSDSEAALRRLREEDACVVLIQHAQSRSGSVTGVRYAVEDLQGVDYPYLRHVHQRLIGEPWTILETKRCIVREMTPEDIPALYEIYAEPETVRYVENLYEDREEEIRYTKAYIENIYSFYEYGIWIIEDKETAQIIGRAGIEYKAGREGVELGFLVARPFWRRGIASEVVEAILIYAKEELDIVHVYVTVEEGNDKSIAFCRKLGFVQTEKHRSDSTTYLVMEKEL